VGRAGDRHPGDWAAQRIKNLSLLNAVTSAFGLGKDQKITTLIEEFQYPRLGPGMMWERCRDLVVGRGGEVRMQAPVARSSTPAAARTPSCWRPASGCPASAVVSSMPMPELVRAMDPPAPAHVLAAAQACRSATSSPSRWSCRSAPASPTTGSTSTSRACASGRVQNFGSWSPQLVKDGFTCLGLEYFVSEGDDLWDSSDEDLIALGKAEIARLGLARSSRSRPATSCASRRPTRSTTRATPSGSTCCAPGWPRPVPNVHPVGRNGMHRYNNQDHSMLTAMLAVDNIVTGAQHDVWTVNVEEDYHETVTADASSLYPTAGSPSTTGASRTGRDAPILPRREREREESAA
jgi:hypothetical protein